MADTIRIKRRLTGSPGAPSGLLNAEVAYNEVDHTLYYGEGSSGGNATNIVPIGGTGMGSNANPVMDGTAAPGVATTWSRADHIHPSDSSRAPLASPSFTGTPLSPTPALADSSTAIATTAFVKGQGYATSASPALTGTPTAPTAPANTNTTQVATTAFVLAQASGTTPLMDGAAAIGTGTTFARADHVHPSDSSRAPIASPTLTGIPAGPTAAPGTNTVQLATTAFVTAAVSASTSGVSQVTAGTGLTGGGTGAVTVSVATNGITNALAAQMPTNTLKGNNTGATGNPADLTIAQTMTMLGAAPLASPGFTGTPTGPTAPNGTNTIQLATTAYVLATRIDQLQPPNIDVAWNSHRITGLLDPASPQDAATKNYVDTTVQGLQVKPTATAATAAALPANVYANGTAGVGATLTASASGALTVDGVAVAAGNVILVKNEAAAANNGLYTVTNPGSASAAYVLTRHIDMDLGTEFSGAFVPVEAGGTTNANTLWLANPVTPVTVGTTAIPFTQLNSATSYVPGNGINISGNTISAVGVANQISVGSSGIGIAASYIGQPSITTLGTVTSGTWNGAPVSVLYGGTGATSLTGYVVGNGTGAMTASASIPASAITGLGTMASQNANAVAITGGTIDGIIIDGGTF